MFCNEISILHDFTTLDELKEKIYDQHSTYRVEIQIGVDLLIIGDKWLIITGLICKERRRRKEAINQFANYFIRQLGRKV
jgi:hypothetical protein